MSISPLQPEKLGVKCGESEPAHADLEVTHPVLPEGATACFLADEKCIIAPPQCFQDGGINTLLLFAVLIWMVVRILWWIIVLSEHLLKTLFDQEYS